MRKTQNNKALFISDSVTSDRCPLQDPHTRNFLSILFTTPPCPPIATIIISPLCFSGGPTSATSPPRRQQPPYMRQKPLRFPISAQWASKGRFTSAWSAEIPSTPKLVTLRVCSAPHVGVAFGVGSNFTTMARVRPFLVNARCSENNASAMGRPVKFEGAHWSDRGGDVKSSPSYFIHNTEHNKLDGHVSERLHSIKFDSET